MHASCRFQTESGCINAFSDYTGSLSEAICSGLFTIKFCISLAIGRQILLWFSVYFTICDLYCESQLKLNPFWGPSLRMRKFCMQRTAELKIKRIATVYLACMATKRTSYTISFKLKVVQKAKQ